MGQDLLKVADVATRLGCSESTVRRLIEGGRLGHYRCPSIRVSELHLQEYLDSTEVRTQEKSGSAGPPKRIPVNRLKHIRL